MNSALTWGHEWHIKVSDDPRQATEFADAIILACGLEHSEARRIAGGVVFGSAAMVLETGQSPAELKALRPLQPLPEAEAKALFREAIESAHSQIDALQAKLSEAN